MFTTTLTLKSLFTAHVDPEDEVDLPEDLEAQGTEEEEEVVEEEVEEDPSPTPVEPAEEMIPKSRYDAERARADALVNVLEGFQRQQPQQQTLPHQRQAVQEEDPYTNYTPEAKQWIQFMLPVVQWEARKLVEGRLNEITPNLQREILVTRDAQDRDSMYLKHKDYAKYEQEINEERARWYQNTGQMPPMREPFYYYVKGKHASAAEATQRTTEVRKVAKAGATVPTKTPTKKVAPKGPLSINDVANMDEKTLEETMIKYGVKF